MISVLAHPTYRNLFLAQVLSLAGTGLTTVALGLLAYDLAGADAGLVLGTALALKMVAYVGVAPVAGALAGRVPRRRFLVSLDLCRALMVLCLPFVTEVWQVYLLVFLFQACSAAFTPTFQATIPDVLADETDYTNALSLSRLAYDLEALLSPVLAGLLLTAASFHWLFVGNGLAFLASAALVMSVILPSRNGGNAGRPFLDRVTRGAWIYLHTPRLRGLLALSFAVSSAGSMVIVNTVVLARQTFGGTDRDVAFFLAAYGVGSMVVAILLPRILDRVGPRSAMLAGGLVLTLVLPLGSLGLDYAAGLALWACLGAGMSLVQTPSGLLLRRSAHEEDRPALFAAQFALSHACWLVAYPAAGWLGATFGLETTFLVLACGSGLGLIAALRVWPAFDPVVIEHQHDDLVHSHGEAHDAHHRGSVVGRSDDVPHRHAALRHTHPFVIDDHHPVWPAVRRAR
ncbi:MAG: MFS transporter [Thalassobaculaceae bacterium]|nr:MFS transporter [Thalassobaculaceae bacterium]